MRFPYRQFTLPGTFPKTTALVFRPLVPVRVFGPAGQEDILGLADTGADETLLPDYLIALLGVTHLSPPVSVVGIGGVILARFGTIDLEIRDSQKSFRWSSYVGFRGGLQQPLLGMKGFLRGFNARFYGKGRLLDLIPNGTAYFRGNLARLKTVAS